MPFIEQNVNKNIIRPQSRSGMLSQLSKYQQVEQMRQKRPKSQLNINKPDKPVFVKEDPSTRLYSTPSPQYKYYGSDHNKVQRPGSQLSITLKKFNPGALVLPLELSNETAYMNRRPQSSLGNGQGQPVELGELGTQLLEKKQQLQQQQIPHDAPTLSRPGSRAATASAFANSGPFGISGDKATYYQRPGSQIDGEGQNQSGAALHSTIDKRKRLEEASRNSLMQIQQSRSLSSFGKAIDTQTTFHNYVKVPKNATNNKIPQILDQNKPALNDWIVQSRAGTARNIQLRQKQDMDKQTFMQSQKYPTVTTGANPDENDAQILQCRREQQEQQVKLNKAELQKKIVETIITTIEDVLPIFKCIAQRLQMEAMLKASDADQLINFFRTNQLNFNPSSALEAMQYGEQYYDNLKQKYANLLKATPDAIANSLISNEFIYLTYDTADVRRQIIKQFLEKSSSQEVFYNDSDPNMDMYHLIVCSFNQINKNSYFTLSGTGITYYHNASQKANNEELGQLISIEEWEKGKQQFEALQKIKFVRNYRILKYMRMWKNVVRENAKSRSLMAIQRLSLLSLEQFCVTLIDVKREFDFGSKFKLGQILFKSYPFYSVQHYLQKHYYLAGKSRMHSKYESYVKRYLTLNPRELITLSTFVNNFRGQVNDIKQQLTEIVQNSSELLLIQARFIQSEIQKRQLEGTERPKSRPGTANAAAQAAIIMAKVNNSTQYNMNKMKSLIRLSDYILIESLIDYLVNINQRIFSAFFGLKFPQIEEEEEDIEEGTIKTGMPVIPGFKVINNPENVQKYYDEMEAKREKDIYELIEQQAAEEADPYDLLVDFLCSLKYEEIAYANYDHIETKAFSFDKQSSKKQADIVTIPAADMGDQSPAQQAAANLLQGLLKELTGDQQQVLSSIPNYLTNVPLIAINSHYPPSPYFYVDMTITAYGIEKKPTEQNFISYVGDCLSELALVFHKAMRPYNYPKLQSFLAEATRTNNMSDFKGLSVKDGIAVYEDYLQTLQQIKWGISYAFSIIKKYEVGIVKIVEDFVEMLRTFNYGGRLPTRTDENLIKYSISILGLPHLEKFEYEDENLFLVYLMTQMNEMQLFKFYEGVLFPRLLNYREIRRRDHPSRYEENSNIVFDFSSSQQLYADEIAKSKEEDDGEFVALLGAISVEQFRRRVAQIQEFSYQLNKLNCSRSFLCFQVSSFGIFQQIVPLLTKFIFFAKICLVRTYVRQMETLQNLIVSYTQQLQKVPDNILILEKTFDFPSFMQIQDSLFDFSQLTGYNPGEDTINRKTEILLQQLQQLQEEIWKKKEVHVKTLKVMDQAKQATRSESGPGSKKQQRSKKRKQSGNQAVQQAEEAEDENVLEPLKQNVLLEDEEIIQLYKVEKHQLSPAAGELLQMLNENYEEEELLNVQNSIKTYDLAKSHLICIKEQIAKLQHLIKYGVENGVLNDIGNITFNDQGTQCLEKGYGIKADTQYKDQYSKLQEIQQGMETKLQQFAVKKPKLYLFFQRSLLGQYVQHAKVVFDFVSGAVFNIHLQDLDLYPGYELLLENTKWVYSGAQSFGNMSQLYLALLFSAECGFQKVEEQIERLRDLLAECDRHQLENAKIHETLTLFDTRDFYLQDSGTRRRTELDDVLQFVKAFLETKLDAYLLYEKLRDLIRGQLSTPLAGVDIDQIVNDLKELQEQFITNQGNMIRLQEQLRKQLKNLQFDDEKNKLNFLDAPSFFRLRKSSVAQSEETTEVSEVSEASDASEKREKKIKTPKIYTSFSLLKIFFFCYKAYAKQLQISLQKTYAEERNAVIQELIDSCNGIRINQENKIFDDHIVYYHEYLEHENNDLRDQILSSSDQEVTDSDASERTQESDEEIETLQNQSKALIPTSGSKIQIKKSKSRVIGAGNSKTIQAQKSNQIINIDSDEENEDYEFDPSRAPEVYLTDLIRPIIGQYGSVTVKKLKLLYSDIDKAKFRQLMQNCIYQFFSPEKSVQLSIDLIQQLVNDLPSLKTLQTIAFQSRHFQELGSILVSPDLTLEFKQLQKLVKAPIALGQRPIVDIMAAERKNPYRSLFGGQGDGIVDLMLFGVIFNSRKESIQKRLETTQLKSIIRISNDTNYEFLHQLENLYNGMNEQTYQQWAQARQPITDIKEMESDKAIRLCDTDVENMADEENIQQKSQVQQALVSTVSLHIEAVQLRMGEIILRRNRNATSQATTGQITKQYSMRLTKGGLFYELDRFTTSVSRLVFRGLYGKRNLHERTMDLIKEADHEFFLLQQLSSLQEKLYGLKLDLRIHIFSEEQKLYTVAESREIITVIMDNLIQLQTLQAQCTRLQKSNIQLAITKLKKLQNECKQAQETIYELLSYQKVFIQLFTVFGQPTQISRVLVEETRQFQKISKMYMQQMQQIHESGGYFLQNCTEDLRTFLNQKIWPESEQVQLALSQYVIQKRSIFSRFYFLSDQTLTSYLSIQISDQFLENSREIVNSGITRMFDGIKEIQIGQGDKDDGAGGRKLMISGIQGKDGMPYGLAEKQHVNLRQSVEQWTSQLQTVLTKQLKDQSISCFYFIQSGFYDMMRFTEQPSHMFINKQLDALMDKFPIQSIIIGRQAYIYKLIQNYEHITNKSLFTKTYNQNLGTGSTIRDQNAKDKDLNESQQRPPSASIQSLSLGPKTPFKLAIDGLICLQKEICKYLAQIIRKKNDILNSNAIKKMQYVLLNELQIFEYLNKCQREKEVYTDCCFYTFREDLEEFYYTHINTLNYAQKCSLGISNVYLNSSSISGYKGIEYGFEYLGLIGRLILTETMLTQWKFILQDKQPLILTGGEGVGKTAYAKDLPRHLGQYNFTVHCFQNTPIAQLTQLLQGACAEGCYLTLDNYYELSTDTVSILAMNLIQIKQALQSKVYQVQLGGIKSPFSHNCRVVLTCLENADNMKSVKLMAHRFRTFSLLKPDVSTIYDQRLITLNFLNHKDLSRRVSLFFKYLQSGYVKPLLQLDVSFRKINALLLLISAYWGRWLKKIKLNERLAELLEPVQESYKQQKEASAFSMYIEQFCVVQAIVSLFISVFDNQIYLEQFLILLKSIFDDKIIDDIVRQQEMSVQQLMRSKVNSLYSSTPMHVMDNTLKGSPGFMEQTVKPLTPLELFQKLCLTEMEVKSLNQLHLGIDMLQDVLDTQVIEEIDMQLLNSTKLKSLKKSKQASGSEAGLRNQDTELGEPQGISSQQAKNYIQHIQSKQVKRIEGQYIDYMKQNNQFIIPEQIDKYCEFEQALLIRNGVILVGEEYSGKTALWKNTLDQQENDYYVINPGYMTEQAIFGFEKKGYFSDGAIGQMIRQAISHGPAGQRITDEEMDKPDMMKDDLTSKKQKATTSGLRFLVFDGPIDSQSAERLKPALDDSRQLELTGIEFLNIPSWVKVIFECKSIENFSPSLISRCAVVTLQRPEDLENVFILKQFRTLFMVDYEEFQEKFKLGSDGDFELTEKYQQLLDERENMTKVQRIPRYKKKTKEELIAEKMSKLLKQDYPYQNNKYANMLRLFSALWTDVLSILDKQKYKYDKISLAQGVLQLFQLNVKDILQSSVQPNIAIRHLRSYMLFSFQYYFFELYGQKHFSQYFYDQMLAEYREIFEINEIEMGTVTFNTSLYNKDIYMPSKFSDVPTYNFGFKLLDMKLNQIYESDIMMIGFEKNEGQLIIQTPNIRLQLFNALTVIRQRLQKIIYLDYYVGKLIMLQNKYSQEFNYIVLDGSTITPETMSDILIDNYHMQGLELVPKVNNIVFYIINSECLSERMQCLLKFVTTWERINVVLESTEYQLKLIDVMFVCVRGESKISIPPLDETLQDQQKLQQKAQFITQTPPLQQVEKQLTAALLIFSQMKNINSTVTPLFQALHNVIIQSIVQVATQYDKFSVQLFNNFLNALLQINGSSFTQYIPDLGDPTFIMLFKRLLVDVVFYLLKVEYFYQLKFTEQQANKILREISDKQLVNHIYELKPTPNLKGKVCLHAKYLFMEQTTCICPQFSNEIVINKSSSMIGQGLVNNSSVALNLLNQNNNNLSHENIQIQAMEGKFNIADLYEYTTEASILQNTQELYNFQIIKPNYEGRMIEHIQMNTPEKDLSQYEVSFKPAYMTNKFVNLTNSMIVEVNERLARLSYLMKSKSCIVTQNIQQQLTFQLVKQVAQQLGFKIISVQARDEQQHSPDYYMVAILKEILSSFIEQLTYGQTPKTYVLYVENSYIQHPECYRIIQEVISQTYSVHDVYDNSILQQLRLLYRDNLELNKIQCINMCKKLFKLYLKIFVLSSHEITTDLEKRYYDSVYYEKLSAWSSSGLSEEGYQLILKNKDVSKEQHKAYQNFNQNGRILQIYGQCIDLLSKGELQQGSQHGQSQEETVYINNSYMTPQSYYKFIMNWFKFSQKSLQRLEGRRNMLLNAIKVFEKSDGHVQKFRQQLEEMRPQLASRQEELSGLLATLQTRKDVAQKIQKEINENTAILQTSLLQLNAEKQASQAKLDSVLPDLEAAANALRGLALEEVLEISKFKEPPQQVIKVAAIICLLLNENTDWTAARIILGKGDILQRLLKLQPNDIGSKQMTAFQAEVRKKDITDIKRLKEISNSLAMLASWSIAFAKYCDVRQNVDPQIEHVKQLQEQYDAKSALLEQKQKQLMELQQELKKIDSDIQSKQNDITELNEQIEAVETQYQQLSSIVQMLQSQWTEWREQAEKISKIQKIVEINGLLLSCYNLLQIDQKEIANNFQELIDCNEVENTIINEIHTKQAPNTKSDVQVEKDESQQQEVHDDTTQEQQQPTQPENNTQEEEKHMQSFSSIINTLIVEEDLIQLMKYNVTNDIYSQLLLLDLYMQDENVVIFDPNQQFIYYVQQIIYQNKLKSQVIDINTYTEKQMQDLKNTITKAMGQGEVLILKSSINSIPLVIQQVLKQIKFDLKGLATQNYSDRQQYNIYIDNHQIEVNARFDLFVVDDVTDHIAKINSELFQCYNIISFQKQSETILDQINSLITQLRYKDAQEKYLQLLQQKAALQNKYKAQQQEIINKITTINIINQDDQKQMLEMMQDFIKSGADIKAELRIIDNQQEEIQNEKNKYKNDSMALTDFYQHLYKLNGYQLNQFLNYIRALGAKNTVKEICNTVQYSLSLEHQQQLKLQLMLDNDYDQIIDTQEKLLLKTMQTFIIQSDPRKIQFVLFAQNGTFQLQEFEQCYQNSLQDKDTIESLFVEKSEQLTDQQLQERQCIMGQLFQGLFQQYSENETKIKKKSSHLSDDSVFYTGAYLCLKNPILSSTLNIDDALQNAIVNTVIMNWQKMFLPMISGQNGGYKLIPEIANTIVQQYRRKSKNSYSWLNVYMELVLIKLFYYERFDQKMDQLINSFHPPNFMHERNSLYQVAEASRGVWVRYMYGYENDILNNLYAYLNQRYIEEIKDNALKAGNTLHIIHLHDLEQQMNQINDESILVISFTLTQQTWQRIWQLNFNKIIIFNQQDIVENMILQYIPCFYTQTVIQLADWCDMMGGAVTTKLQELSASQAILRPNNKSTSNISMITDEQNVSIIAAETTQRLDFLKKLILHLQDKGLQLVKQIELVELSIIYNTAYEHELLFYGASLAPDVYQQVNFLANLCTLKTIRNQFHLNLKSLIHILQIPGGYPNLEFLTQQPRRYNPKSDANILKQLIKIDIYKLPPLKRYFVIEALEYDRYMREGKVYGESLGLPKDVYNHMESQLKRIKAGNNITYVQVKNVTNPKLFFQYLYLQAVHMFGGFIDDYKLIFGTKYENNDIALEFTLYNGKFNKEKHCIEYNGQQKQSLILRAAAIRTYKRRTVILPLSNIQQIEEQLNQQAGLQSQKPSMRSLATEDLSIINMQRETRTNQQTVLNFEDLLATAEQQLNNDNRANTYNAFSPHNSRHGTTNLSGLRQVPGSRPGSAVANQAINSKALAFEKRLNKFLGTINQQDIFKGDNVTEIPYIKNKQLIWRCPIAVDEQLLDMQADLMNVRLE